jgi:hypothetical protein
MSATTLLLSLAFEGLWDALPDSPYFDGLQACLSTAGLVFAGAVIAFLMVWAEFEVRGREGTQRGRRAGYNPGRWGCSMSVGTAAVQGAKIEAQRRWLLRHGTRTSSTGDSFKRPGAMLSAARRSGEVCHVLKPRPSLQRRRNARAPGLLSRRSSATRQR